MKKNPANTRDLHQSVPYVSEYKEAGMSIEDHEIKLYKGEAWKGDLASEPRVFKRKHLQLVALVGESYVEVQDAQGGHWIIRLADWEAA